jgi:hypothetical protein
MRAGEPVAFLQTQMDQRHPEFSPDGRMLAYSSNESGRFQVYVRDFPDRGRRSQVSNDGGVYPKWSRTAPEVFFRTEDNSHQGSHATRRRADRSLPREPQAWNSTTLAESRLEPEFRSRTGRENDSPF